MGIHISIWLVMRHREDVKRHRNKNETVIGMKLSIICVCEGIYIRDTFNDWYEFPDW